MSDERRRFEALPAGVRIVKDFRDGSCLLECTHEERHQFPTGGWVAWQPGQGPDTQVLDIPLKTDVPDGWVLDYKGRLVCGVCKGDEVSTEGFQRRVKMVAFVSEDAREGQEALF